MATVGHLDIIGGISGDMFLGALLSAGVDREKLESEIRKVVPQGWWLVPSEGSRGAIHGIEASVVIQEDKKWSWDEFRNAVKGSELNQDDRSKVLSVLDILESAEGEAHGDGDSELHELGSTDTIVDIVGSVVGLRLLGIESLTYSALPASSGTAVSSHGETASFAPATMSIIKQHRLRVRSGIGISSPTGEAVTPTGAALVAALANSETDQSYAIQTSGAGLGSRDSASPPNALGLWVCEATEDSVARVDLVPSASSVPEVLVEVREKLGLKLDLDVWLVEANLDDCTGEVIGYTLSVLREHIGVLDAWTHSISMKKNRPGVVISALVETADLGKAVGCMMYETSTFGVRVRQAHRVVAERDTKAHMINGDSVKVHRKRIGGKIRGRYPEYEDCARVADGQNRLFHDVYSRAVFIDVLKTNRTGDFEQDSDDE